MNKTPHPAELEILQILWIDGSSTVRQVFEKISEIKTVKYTTTLKTMQIMHEKGYLSREPQGKGHIYTAVVNEEETNSNLVDTFVKKTFGGSALKLVMKAIGNNKTSQQEIDDIRNYLNNLKKEDND